ncbi:MAG: YkgJ family cysteine cluster protein [Desulfobacterales bacterium]|nr:YkgJ family cysteine cluster protein [Desulfobacterales bacterium]
MTEEFTAVSPDESFQFSCSPDVPCFNECCQDLNQFLSPYDIIRLKNHFNMTSGEFLQRYTAEHMGPETGLPVITLKPENPDDMKCPFVTPAGCSVYPDRPASCRIYPMARAVARSRETGRLTEHFAILKEPHCLGHRQDQRQTASDWITDQGMVEYNELNDMFLEIISLKNVGHPNPLDIRERHMFHLAMYDIDAFRANALEKGLLDDLDAPPETMEAIKEDDVALLRLAHQWVKSAIFR